MSSRDWRAFAQIAGLIVAVCVGSLVSPYFTAQPLSPPAQQPKNQSSAYATQEVGRNDKGQETWTTFVRNPTAFSTVAVAIFTGVLTVAAILQLRSLRQANNVARRAAEAARLSADALVGAERSHLFVRVTSQSLQDVIQRAAMWGSDMDEGHIEPRLVVKYVIKNFGSSPAIIREISHTLVALVELPAEPNYSDPRPIAFARILAGGDETPEIECVCATWTTVKMARQIAGGEVPFWFFGRVVYEDVITGAEHVEPFLYVYAGAGFNPDYRPAYNQRT